MKTLYIANITKNPAGWYWFVEPGLEGQCQTSVQATISFVAACIHASYYQTAINLLQGEASRAQGVPADMIAALA